MNSGQCLQEICEMWTHTFSAKSKLLVYSVHSVVQNSRQQVKIEHLAQYTPARRCTPRILFGGLYIMRDSWPFHYESLATPDEHYRPCRVEPQIDLSLSNNINRTSKIQPNSMITNKTMRCVILYARAPKILLRWRSKCTWPLVSYGWNSARHWHLCLSPPARYWNTYAGPVMESTGATLNANLVSYFLCHDCIVDSIAKNHDFRIPKCIL